ncbi:MAG: hypothetical protein J6Y78_03045 [Paludibacteraceae bacterium]|nr:hypothetical protein [Paludibacteraceae bacterium]
MKVEVKIEERGCLSLLINGTKIPLVSEILHAEGVSAHRTAEDTFEIDCDGVEIYEDEDFKTLHVKPIKRRVYL